MARVLTCRKNEPKLQDEWDKYDALLLAALGIPYVS
jgi:hypothetical protein